jgi:hypothetical protein
MERDDDDDFEVTVNKSTVESKKSTRNASRFFSNGLQDSQATRKPSQSQGTKKIAGLTQSNSLSAPMPAASCSSSTSL